MVNMQKTKRPKALVAGTLLYNLPQRLTARCYCQRSLPAAEKSFQDKKIVSTQITKKLRFLFFSLRRQGRRENFQAPSSRMNHFF